MKSNIDIVRSYIIGDVNYDWSIDVIDALLVAQYYVGFFPLIDMYPGDVNGDSEVDIIDALLIAQFYVRLILEFPVNVNTPPIAYDDSAVTNENAPIIINVLANDTDVDGDVLTISMIGAPLHGRVAITSGMIMYTSDLSFIGDDLFTYTISDGRGGFDTAHVSVTVNEP